MKKPFHIGNCSACHSDIFSHDGRAEWIDDKFICEACLERNGVPVFPFKPSGTLLPFYVGSKYGNIYLKEKHFNEICQNSH